MNIIAIMVLVILLLSFRKVCSNMANDFSGYENSQNNKFIDITQSFILIFYAILWFVFVAFLGKGLSTFEVFQSQIPEVKILCIFIPPNIATYLFSVFASKQAVNYGLKKGLIKKTDVKKNNQEF
ncbi:hypothetical protein [Methanococcus maripaludis]|uniref:Uncharacterized protein n=2 Tax=Methanococcus maripaludis TaxID=39152 RepID=A0A8T4CNT2_METMI|nr:hypothetical protein [Methanococcus maripaludis]MBM7408733.1 hypothetical protein [Methanococcus maripaludis]MBP2220345.1 hypothetical protein [Methanococcus maripaludis]